MTAADNTRREFMKQNQNPIVEWDFLSPSFFCLFLCLHMYVLLSQVPEEKIFQSIVIHSTES
jgi:hypothetical protein